MGKKEKKRVESRLKKEMVEGMKLIGKMLKGVGVK
jgi:hypothetical protein